MQQDHNRRNDGLDNQALAAANAENEDAFAGAGEASGGPVDDTAFSDEHPLASPGELAGTADQAIAAEMAALGNADGSLSEAAGIGGAAATTMGDAIGAGAGMDVGSGTDSDRSGLGGGEPLDQQDGSAPATSRSLGGNGGA